MGEKKSTWYADEIRKCQSRIGGHFFASVNRMLATAPAPPPEGTGLESDARRVPFGQTLPKRDVRVTSELAPSATKSISLELKSVPVSIPASAR